MGIYKNLKAAIADVITTNGKNEITGAILNDVLQNIVSSIGEYATFAGIATPDMQPGTVDQNVFYLATIAGTYIYFDGIVVNSGEVAILTSKTGSWKKKFSGLATQEKLTELEKLSFTIDSELSETSKNAVGNKAVTMALSETEEVAAAALNELNKRFEEYATKEDIDATLVEMDKEINHIEGVLDATIIEDEEVIAAALNDLDKRLKDIYEILRNAVLIS